MSGPEIISLISSKVKAVSLDGTRPTVCISGGIDSTIVLHHVIHDLMGGNSSRVYTVTALFGNGDERDKARRVAEHYRTSHSEVVISRDEFFSMLPVVLRYYPFPRYNLWTWVLLKHLACSHLFIGEGGDEIFGYGDRSFLEGWAGQLVWVHPAWKVACDYYGINLHAPFSEIQSDWYPVITYYSPPAKVVLREAYTGVIPDFVIGQSSTPPSIGFYNMVGMSKEELQIEAAKIWLKVRNIS